MTSVQRILHLLGAVAATLLLIWAARSAGPAGVALNLLVALPAAFVHMRLGSAVGVLAVAASAGSLYLLGDSGSAAAYLMQFGSISLILPLLLRRGWAWDRAVGASLLVLVGVATATLYGYASYRDAPVGELVTAYVHSEVETALAIYEGADLAPEQLEEVRRFVEWSGEFMLSTWPALAVVASGVMLLLTVFFLSALANGRYRVPGCSFRTWKTPEVLIWGLILAGFTLFFSGGGVQLAARNVLAILLPLYFLHGLAIVAFYFDKKSLAPFVRGVGYLLLALLNPLPLVVTALGVFDLWVDFRKPRITNAT